MNRNTVRLMALVAAVGLAACGDSTDLVQSELSEAEASDLAGAVMFATFNSTGEVPQPAPGGPQAVPFTYAAEFQGDVMCPGGGHVGVAASMEVSGDTESTAGHVEYAMTQIHDACVTASESGRLFTLWGNPDLSVAFAVDNNGQGVVEWGGSVQGAVDWVTENREGSCEVDVEFSGRQEGTAAVSGSFVGLVCGFNLSRTFSIG